MVWPHDWHEHDDDQLRVWLDRRLTHLNDQQHRILQLLDLLTTQGVVMAADLTAITNAVEANTAVDESAIVLLNQLAGRIEALKNDPVALQALADQINSESGSLAAAVQANTPADTSEPTTAEASPNEPTE